MNEVLRTASRLLIPLLLLFSLFLLARGHDAPGGGFAGGLMAAAAILLDAAARGAAEARQSYRFPLLGLGAAGLGAMLAVALLGPLGGEPLLSHSWVELRLPLLGALQLGTPHLFELGVYLAVLGCTLAALLALEERGEPVLGPGGG